MTGLLESAATVSAAIHRGDPIRALSTPEPATARFAPAPTTRTVT
ncbi:hypothetical protein [Kutzneria sp. CA-103260]|nr:hypothetical protein [Kutzneria sp. CA-103260]